MVDAIAKDGLSPVAGANGSQKADVVFVHGFMGDARTTWESPNIDKSFWPEWLADDLSGVAVWSFGYESTLVDWLKKGHSLESLAALALGLFQAEGLGSRPLLFVTHSLGGIIVKNMIDVAISYKKGEYAYIAEKISGIEFIAVPHRGTKIADHWLTVVKAIWGNQIKLERIRWADDTLMQLHRRFVSFKESRDGCLFVRSLCEKNNLEKKFSIGGTQFTIPTPIMVVDKVSADPEFQEFLCLEIDEDHNGICKPSDREHNTYILTKRFIQLSLERVKITIGDDHDEKNHLSDADRGALVKSLMGPQVNPAQLGRCPSGGKTPCGVRTNSVYLISEMNQTMGATFETLRFLDHCKALNDIALKIMKSIDETKPEKLSHSVQQLWKEFGSLVSFFKNLSRYDYRDKAGNEDSWRDKPYDRMEEYYDRRVLYRDDVRNVNKDLKPLLRNMWTVYEKLSELEAAKKAWRDRVEAITTDETYLGPVRRFSEEGGKVIDRLRGLRDGRLMGTSSALSDGFASPNLSDLPGCFECGIEEMPHTKSSDIPRPRKDGTKN